MKKRGAWQDYLFSIVTITVAVIIFYSSYTFNEDQTNRVISSQPFKSSEQPLIEGVYRDRVDRVTSLENSPEASHPSKLDAIGEEEISFWKKLDHYPVIVAESKQDPEYPGATQKIKIVKTDFEYPFIRVVESYDRPNQQEADRRVAMVADHVLVSLRPGYTQQDLEQVTDRFGVRIRKKLDSKLQTYLVSFEYKDPNSLDRIVEDFKKEGEAFMVVQPDYLQNL